jgi:hypothetical protein
MLKFGLGLIEKRTVIKKPDCTLTSGFEYKRNYLRDFRDSEHD